jgi:hypothetical protein
LEFEINTIQYNYVQIHINRTLTNFEQLTDNPGALDEQYLKCTSMKNLFDEVQLMEIEKKYATKAIKWRFMNMATDKISKAMSVFDTFIRPKISSAAFCIEEITTIISLYMGLLQKSSKEDKLSVTGNMLHEWYEFRVCAEHLGLKNLLAKAESQLSKLLKLITVLPASICRCEMGSSIIN